MSITLTMNGKNLIQSKFTLIRNPEDTLFIFGIPLNNYKDYSFVHNDFLNNLVNFWYKNKTFFFETKENIYMFDMGDFAFKIPLNTKVATSLTNIDSEGNIIVPEIKRVYFLIKKH